jgi:hypothetical protein
MSKANESKISVNVLQVMINCMSENNAAAPDSVAETVFEQTNELHFLSDQKQNEIYDAIHSLASCLVKDIGQYL